MESPFSLSTFLMKDQDWNASIINVLLRNDKWEVSIIDVRLSPMLVIFGWPAMLKSSSTSSQKQNIIERSNGSKLIQTILITYYR